MLMQESQLFLHSKYIFVVLADIWFIREFCGHYGMFSVLVINFFAFI